MGGARRSLHPDEREHGCEGRWTSCIGAVVSDVELVISSIDADEEFDYLMCSILVSIRE